ncbi:MAG: sulfite exporter TauE/SafE family protein [Thaumarchaeota archaeon]|nr:sulfite exporter TauE/SafE family protein [Nitrososphaerota archaeon]
MSPLVFLLLVFLVSIAAGFLGSLLGLGGGVIVIPVLTLLFDVDIRLAIGASIVSVIATSSGAAAAYVREKITNIRIGMFLEIATTIGAVTGAVLAALVHAEMLFTVFGVILVLSVIPLLRKISGEQNVNTVGDRWAQSLGLAGRYYDQSLGKEVEYRADRTPLGFGMMYVAGLISGLLGIGSGPFKVLAMDLGMRLPVKVSSATSNFMIGVTAAASAGIYFLRGDVNPFVAAPVALGVLLGASVGARWLPRVRNNLIRGVFAVVLVAVALQMIIRGAGVGV